jgi:hypothetical protein
MLGGLAKRSHAASTQHFCENMRPTDPINRSDQPIESGSGNKRLKGGTLTVEFLLNGHA